MLRKTTSLRGSLGAQHHCWSSSLSAEAAQSVGCSLGLHKPRCGQILCHPLCANPFVPAPLCHPLCASPPVPSPLCQPLCGFNGSIQGNGKISHLSLISFPAGKSLCFPPFLGVQSSPGWQNNFKVMPNPHPCPTHSRSCRKLS